MIHFLIYNGESSANYGLLVGGQKSYDLPKRDVTKYSITGRNGDLIKDNGRFENIKLDYTLVCKNDFEAFADAISAWLKQPTEYCRLEDSHHPEYYRMALVTDSISYDTGTWNRSAKATVSFDCKPEKYLFSGEWKEKFSTTGEIFNPTRFPSKPLIRVYGTGAGKLTIGAYTIDISAINEYIDIDSDIMDCYKGNDNCNAAVTLAKGFPVLAAGKTAVSFNGAITAVEIQGRWWTI